MFETVSFHLVKPCNMSCKFCYATYNTVKVGSQLNAFNVFIILEKLKEAGLHKVTFAGGEPLLYKDIIPVIIYAKNIGLTTSIITNGALLEYDLLDSLEPYLDWLGISIDSIDPKVNTKIGRLHKGKPIDYKKLIDPIQSLFNFKLKINTVVNIHNQHENMTDFIDWTGTTRWKVFDTLRVEGQNEQQFNEIKSTQYKEYINRNTHGSMVAEDNSLMSGSYLLINPLGQFYENWGSNVNKSDSLITHSVEHCLSQIKLDRRKFIERGGIYNWK